MKYKAIWSSLIIIVVMLISGCAQSQDNFHERAKLAEQNEEDIVIGVAWDFRNDLFEQGVDLAIEEINENGGILGKKLQVIKGDDQSSVTQGLTVAESFANNLDMVAVIGHRKSSISVPAATVYENAGLLMITPASTSPQLTNKGYNLVFSSITNDEQIGNQLSMYAADSGYQNIAIFYSDEEYGRGLANAFEDGAVENGINIIDRSSSYSNLNDLERIVNTWRVLDIDAVFLADDMPRAANVITDFRKVGLDVPILGGNTLDSSDLGEIAGKAAEGTVVGSVFNPNDRREETVNFVKTFNERYKVAPNSYASQGYDAVYLLANAIQLANSTVPEKMADALREMDAWGGVTGKYSFADNGSLDNKPIVKKIFRNGQFDYLDEEGS